MSCDTAIKADFVGSVVASGDFLTLDPSSVPARLIAVGGRNARENSTETHVGTAACAASPCCISPGAALATLSAGARSEAGSIGAVVCGKALPHFSLAGMLGAVRVFVSADIPRPNQDRDARSTFG